MAGFREHCPAQPAMACQPALVAHLSNLEFLARIGTAAGLGFVVGWERNVRGRPAGDRTFGLLALGAAAFTAFALSADAVGFSRVVQGITTAVGFIGAGIVWRKGGDVHGLTTAAAAWSMVAVGVLAGSGRFAWAGMTTVVVLVLLEAAHLPLLERLDPRRFEDRFRNEAEPPRPLGRHRNDDV
jgi:putative Mg2+ transporter-C (MgtC) family protein